VSEARAATPPRPAKNSLRRIVGSAPEARRGFDGLRRTHGDKATTKVTLPTETITEGLQRIDGVTYDFKRFVDAESDLQLAALLPEQKVLMVFDLVF
jgi:hypothetical protein